MPPDLVAVVEAAYRFDVGDADWMRGVLAAAQPFVDQGLGAWGFVFDGHAFLRGELAYEHPTALGLPDDWLVGLRATLAVTSQESRAMHEIIFGSPCHTMSEILRHQAKVMGRATRAIAVPGVHDSVGVTARDSSGAGIFIGAHSPRVLTLDARSRARYGRMAAHIATAYRLRRRLHPSGICRSDDLVGRAEAILGPNRRLEHAVGIAASKAGLDALREAAVATDRATRLRRRDPDEALRAWEALVAGRWSLVASIDRDGRRLLLAQQNEPAPFADEPDLAPREQHRPSAKDHRVRARPVHRHRLDLGRAYEEEAPRELLRRAVATHRSDPTTRTVAVTPQRKKRPEQAPVTLPDDLCSSELQLGSTRYLVLSFAIDDTRADGSGPALSRAEREILALLVAGRSNAEIARSRQTSVRTVANQLARLYRKLGVDGRNEIIAYATRSG